MSFGPLWLPAGFYTVASAVLIAQTEVGGGLPVPIVQLLVSLPSTGVALIVAWYGMQYIRERDRSQEKKDEKHADELEKANDRAAERLEKIIDKFDVHMNNTFAMQREMVKEMVEVKNELEESRRVKQTLIEVNSRLIGMLDADGEIYRAIHRGAAAQKRPPQEEVKK